MTYKPKTLNEDFNAWWKLPKYKNSDIEARDKFGELEVLERIADTSCTMWPGPENDVKYFVRLTKKVCVGFSHEKPEGSKRYPNLADFPVYEG